MPKATRQPMQSQGRTPAVWLSRGLHLSDLCHLLLCLDHTSKKFSAMNAVFQEENGDYTYVERVKIPLDHGTLLIMEGATQADWQVRVCKSRGFTLIGVWCPDWLTMFISLVNVVKSNLLF